MTNINSLLVWLRIKLMYLVALLLILLIPLIFFSFGSGLLEKVAKKIPLREGNFTNGGQLNTSRPAAPH